MSNTYIQKFTFTYFSLGPLELSITFLQSVIIYINISIIIGITFASRGSCKDVKISSDLNRFDILKLER